MAVGPSDEAIGTFSAITGLPHDNAIAWLQAHSNEVEKATNAFFDGGGAQLPQKPASVQWIENAYDGEKSGEGQQNSGSAANQSDTLKPNAFGAPSRPPSRVSNRDERQAAPQYVETEEEQVNRAMAMSLSESQTLPGQETGVTELNKSAPGPTQYYDTEQWSMVLSSSQTQEIFLNPEAANRKRQPDSPALLKPIPDAHHLSAFIKILHVIPVAREALLNADIVAPDYGRDTQWWDGEPIKQLRVVNVEQGYQGVDNQDLVQETQRLMAFLDNTERAYGSAEGLARLQSKPTDKDRLSTFLDDWQEATCDLAPDEPLRNIFQSRGVRRDPEAGDKIQNFSCLPLNVDAAMVENGSTLYNAVEEVIWEDPNGPEIFLKDIGSIVSFNITCWNTSVSGIGIEIPATWYPDRYLESSVSQSKQYLERKQEYIRKWDLLEMMKEKLLKFGTADTSSLLAKTMSYLEQKSAYQAKAREDDKLDGPMDTEIPLQSDDVLEQLKVLGYRIDNKLKTLEKMKASLMELERKNSLLYTAPTDDPETCPTHEYTLRGVATTPSTCYVLEKAKRETNDDLITMEDPEWEWWKLEYVSSDANPVFTKRVSEDDVLKAARFDSRNVLLVYADKSAIDYHPSPLPLPLANFVLADNLNFQAELNDYSQPPRDSPSKRKAQSEDVDDLIVEHPRSPPFERDALKNEVPLDDAPGEVQPDPQYTAPLLGPSYLDQPNNDHHLPPPPKLPPTTPPRTLRPKPAGRQTTDDTIPITLRSPPTQREPSPPKPQEMQERNMGTGLLQGKGAQSNTGYRLGDYVPELNMEDSDEERKEQAPSTNVVAKAKDP